MMMVLFLVISKLTAYEYLKVSMCFHFDLCIVITFYASSVRSMSRYSFLCAFSSVYASIKICLHVIKPHKKVPIDYRHQTSPHHSKRSNHHSIILLLTQTRHTTQCAHHTTP